jgi:hypothetical protein
MHGEKNHMAHDRLKAETTETACISRTELHDEPEHRVHRERTTRRRLLRFIERSVPAYASDAELLRVAAELSGARRGE